jgi:hypothetical protein
MTARAKKKLQTFHAMMMVTRMEEWCVDAKNVEEAKMLLAAGEGHRCSWGDAIQVDLTRLFENH